VARARACLGRVESGKGGVEWRGEERGVEKGSTLVLVRDGGSGEGGIQVSTRVSISVRSGFNLNENSGIC
jgi:hypothetical protein